MKDVYFGAGWALDRWWKEERAWTESKGRFFFSPFSLTVLFVIKSSNARAFLRLDVCFRLVFFQSILDSKRPLIYLLVDSEL